MISRDFIANLAVIIVDFDSLIAQIYKSKKPGRYAECLFGHPTKALVLARRALVRKLGWTKALYLFMMRNNELKLKLNLKVVINCYIK